MNDKELRKQYTVVNFRFKGTKKNIRWRTLSKYVSMHRITYHVTKLTADKMILAQGLPHKINPKFCSKQDIRLFFRLKEILKDDKAL